MKTARFVVLDISIEESHSAGSGSKIKRKKVASLSAEIPVQDEARARQLMQSLAVQLKTVFKEAEDYAAIERYKARQRRGADGGRAGAGAGAEATDGDDTPDPQQGPGSEGGADVG